ncbi:hypothetical protein B0H13DRAFT_1628309, partial [Mycena leptocephala]
NRTIDDQFGDSVSGVLPSYSPFPVWNVGASCNTSCAVHPDPTLAFNHTWHDNSQFPAGPPVSLSLDFVGIAIDVFCIIPPLVTNNTALRYNLSFDLDDGTHRGTYTYTPTSSEFEYNVSVVSLPSLPNKAHTLLISTNDPVHGSIFLFDYAVYTYVKNHTSILKRLIILQDGRGQ